CALVAAAGAAGLRHAGGRTTTGVLRSGGEAARRLPRRLPRLLGPLPGREPRLLPRRRLPDRADLEPPVVRGLPVGVYGGGLAAAAPCAAGDGARWGAAGHAAGRRPDGAAGARAAARPGARAAGRALPVDPCPG